MGPPFKHRGHLRNEKKEYEGRSLGTRGARSSLYGVLERSLCRAHQKRMGVMTGPLDFCSYSSSGSAVETDRDSFGNPKYGQSVSLRLEISSSKLANASRIVMTGSVLHATSRPQAVPAGFLGLPD